MGSLRLKASATWGRGFDADAHINNTSKSTQHVTITGH
jgi:hypothetical protein